jgi:hypothetical protein
MRLLPSSPLSADGSGSRSLLSEDPKGSWLYAYFSLIDPDAPDLNFSIIGDHPYLYYVRLDNNSQNRVLFRGRVSILSTTAE